MVLLNRSTPINFLYDLFILIGVVLVCSTVELLLNFYLVYIYIE